MDNGINLLSLQYQPGGDNSLLLFFKRKMIDRSLLKSFIEQQLEGSDYFLVDVKVKQNNEIEVEIDSDGPVDIEECEKLTRAIESQFDRDKEDYMLEVGSSGLTAPFKVERQYRKYLGQEVEVITADGKKLTGMLKSVDDDTFTVISKEKVKKPDKKRPVMEDVEHIFRYDEIKQTKYLLKF